MQPPIGGTLAEVVDAKCVLPEESEAKCSEVLGPVIFQFSGLQLEIPNPLVQPFSNHKALWSIIRPYWEVRPYYHQ